MEKHGRLWKNSSAQVRASFEKKAEVLRQNIQDKIRGEQAEVDAEMRLLRQRMCEERVLDEPLRLTSCRWTQAQIAELKAAFDGNDWPSSRVDDLRAAALRPVAPPDQHTQDLLDSMEVDSDDGPVDHLPWLSFVCQQRDFFKSTILRFLVGDEWVCFKFIFAMQSPRLVCLLRVFPGDIAHSYIDPSNFDQLALEDWPHMWQFDHLDFVFSDEGALAKESVVEVVSDVISRGGQQFVSDGEWLSLSVVQSMLTTAATPSTAAEQAPRKTSIRKEVDLEAIPWALDLLGAAAWPGPPKDLKKTASSGGGATSDEDEASECVVDPMQVMDELMQRRFALADNGKDHEAHFRWQLRGGAWTAAHKGISFDAFSAGPILKGGLAERFCLEWGVTRSASYSIALYGEQTAHTLAKAWVHKHEWFYMMFVAHEDEEAWGFTDQVMEEYEEPAALAELERSGSKRVQERIAAMRRIRPKRPE